MISKFLILLACVSFAFATEAERLFTSSEGDEVRATFISLDENLATLLRPDGKSFETPLSFLSARDREYIALAHQRQVKLQEEAKKLNAAAGQKLSNGISIVDTDAQQLASNLRLPSESTSKHGKSWRLYAGPKRGYKLFDAIPYSVALYSDEGGTVSHLSIVYANKGDFGSTAGFGRDHFDSDGPVPESLLKDAMEKDEELIEKSLISILGEPTRQRYGEGDTRRTIKRWDWNGSAFLLSNEEGEYVSLSVVSKEFADDGGKAARMRDSDLKERLIANVKTEENGDVYITEIPMVNQGPKGYCVPATFERAMRTMGIDADMYLLAMIGNSSAGGGTSVSVLLDNVKSAVYRKGRRTKDERIKSLKIRDVKREIDKGIPLMWTMYSVDIYNDMADKNTSERVSGSSSFREKITEEAAEIADLPKPDSNRHVCMIIGYNEKTQEVAVSDSWGKRFELRWVPLEVADWASSGRLFMILP
ncbi:MAG: C39 family peptidase [Akkermansiaceae bacterium]